MPLELAAVTTASTTKAPKQIMAVNYSNGATMYEVPAGREFTGVIGSATYQYFPTINGTGNHSWSQSGSTQPVQVTLVEGTVVAGSGSTTTWIMGVERDA